MPSNRLALEKSPYLLQHAANPVDWYPWGEEAFEKARREDKPVFLSIGYSTCHWCHVMEHESFENDAIAELMNRWFVCIKIDREERPDIDRIYMTYVQATSGGGGWPMSVWLTPDLKPFVGGTYFPPDNRYGRAGFPVVLERIAEAWKNDRAKIVESSEQVMRQLREAAAASATGSSSADPALLDSAFQQFRRAFDSRLGGFGSAPKFPRPSVHNFLLRYARRTGNEEASDMVGATLIGMQKGGMNDQLGGGFHRYSVDEYWFVPHFEKMLYDQAQLVVSYLEAFQLTGNAAFEDAVRRTLDYVLRDMTSPEGGFWSAEDADSARSPEKPREKSEGFFYIWSWDEAVRLLGDDSAARFAYRYGMEREGNVRNDPHAEFTGLNILFAAHTLEDAARHFGEPVNVLARDVANSERLLFEARAARPRPHLDDKILTAWNGLMISAFAKAGAALGEPRYSAAAVRAADFILTRLRTPEGALLRRYRAGDAAVDGMLDDHAFFAQALLDLYETSGAFRFLDAAIDIVRRQSQRLEDPAGGFFASAHADAAELMRVKDDYDGTEPSGNSIALMNLLRLHRMTGEAGYRDSARRLIAALAPRASAAPSGMPQLLAALEFDIAPTREVVLAGDVPAEMLRMLWGRFEPGRIVLYASAEIAAWRPATAAMTSGVYICENFVCSAPARTAEELAPLLK